MGLGPRLDLRQSQSLVMTPQLQQAIKLLALSNIEIESFIGDAIAANPLLDIGSEPGDAADPDRTPDMATRTTALETSSVDRLIGEGRGADDRPLDIDPAAATPERDTGDGATGEALDASWSAEMRLGGAEDGPGIDERGTSAQTLAEHLEAQIGLAASDARLAAIARYLIGLLDDAGYLPVAMREVCEDLSIPLADGEAALVLVQSLDPTGVGARTLSECIALQAREADRYDPCMARLIDNLDLVARGEFGRLRKMCGVDEEDFADMMGELRAYDPKPGLRFGGESGGGGDTGYSYRPHPGRRLEDRAKRSDLAQAGGQPQLLCRAQEQLCR